MDRRQFLAGALAGFAAGIFGPYVSRENRPDEITGSALFTAELFHECGLGQNVGSEMRFTFEGHEPETVIGRVTSVEFDPTGHTVSVCIAGRFA